MGPFGSSVASTFLMFTLFLPYILLGTVADYRFKSFVLVTLIPTMVSFFVTNQSIAPYFVIPWEVVIPLVVILYGIIMLISLLNKDYRNAAGGGKSSLAGRGYLALTIFIVLMLGMLAYYFTGLYETFSPLGTTA